MTDSSSLGGHLLIAMPNLADPNFHRSVVLIGVHSADEGAFGLVINQPLDIDLRAVLDELGEAVPARRLPQVLCGGPVESHHGFVLFDDQDLPPDGEALRVGTGIAVSGSTSILSGLVHSPEGRRFNLVLGYSGWFPGQLEREIEENSWLVAPVDTSIVFDTPPESRWRAALRSIGVDPGTLVDAGGGVPS